VLLQVGRAIPTTPWELVLTSSRETKFVLAILVVFSLVSWYLIALKWWQFRRMRQQADRFMTEIERAARLEDAYHAAMRLPSSPYNRLLREGMHFFGELKPGGLKADGPIEPPQRLSRPHSSRHCGWCSPRRSRRSGTPPRASSRGSRRSAR